tara:strand:+ start:950 stop:1504 length:555 start_codon:yes stop_codon:yes gene_type:complete
MEDMALEKLRYPVGKFVKPVTISNQEIDKWIFEIESFPLKLKLAVNDLSEEELQWQYRSGSWTIKQLIHHCADSHMNSFIRFKLSLTEDSPIIKPYLEDKWAQLADSSLADTSLSLKIIEGLHQRWAILLKSLANEELNRAFVHPEHGKHFSLKENIGIYAWHCNHHLGHIKLAIEAKGEIRNK